MVNTHIENMQKYHRSIDPQVPDGFVIFLGDSITQGLANQVVIPCSVNYGIGASSTFDLLNFIDNYRSLETASAIVLMIGINDFGNGVSRGIDDRMRNIVDRIPKTTPLVLNSIMPASRKNIDNEIIKKPIKVLFNYANRAVIVNT